jgi:hypothetical protein
VFSTRGDEAYLQSAIVQVRKGHHLEHVDHLTTPEIYTFVLLLRYARPFDPEVVMTTP